MLGCGLTRPGQVLDISGTSTSIAAYTHEPVYDPAGTMLTHLSANGRYWTLENASLITGGNLRWHKDTIARCSYEEMDQAAMDIAPGSEGLIFLPYLQGQITPAANSSARGVFAGLTMNHAVAHMTHAVYEANVFTIRDCIEVISRSVGTPEMIIGTGGGTRSELCCQMKADCLGIPFQVMASENATGIGAGILAGMAEGLFASAEDAVHRYVKKGKNDSVGVSGIRICFMDHTLISKDGSGFNENSLLPFTMRFSTSSRVMLRTMFVSNGCPSCQPGSASFTAL